MESIYLITKSELIPLLSINSYVSVFAIIGSFWSILTIIVLKPFSTSLGKMVILLAIFDIIFGLSSQMAIITTDSEFICQIRCFLWAFSWTGSIFLTCCFAHGLYATVKSLDGTMPDLYFKRYFITATLLSFVWGTYSLIIEQFQIKDEICYHNSARKDLKSLQVIIFQSPLYFGIVFSLGCYVSVIRELMRANSRVYIELLFYPLILIICNLPVAVRRLIIAFDKNFELPFWVVMISAILQHSQGILNALVYGLSKTVIKQYKEKCISSNPQKIKSNTLLGSTSSTGTLGLNNSRSTLLLPSDSVSEI